MLQDLRNEFASVKFLTHLLLIAIIIYLIQIFLQILNTFSDIVLIIVFAWILSFILEPIVYFTNRKFKVPVTLSTLFVYLLFGAVISIGIYLLIPIVSEQVQILAKNLPFYLKSSPPAIQNASIKFLDSLGNVVFLLPSVAQFLVYFITTLILSFYLIVERDTISKTIHKLTPRTWRPHMLFFEKAVDQTMASFLRVQVTFGIISGVFTFIVMLAFGINFAPSTSVIAGLLTVIPVIGTILALIPPFLVALVQDPSKALFILAILLVGQQVIYNVLGPRLIGGAFKIHPIIVLLSLLVGLKVAGLIGSIFAIPIVSIATVVGKEILANMKEDDK